MTTISYAQLEAVAARAGIAVGAAELHGSLAGYLCAGWGGDARELLVSLEIEISGTGADAALYAQVDAVARDLHAKFRNGDPVVPLLPDTGITRRADAMVDWCRGFLGGLGLTGVLGDSARRAENDRVLADFGRIAAAHLEAESGDEAVLAGLLDFIADGVARLHRAFAPAAPQ